MKMTLLFELNARNKTVETTRILSVLPLATYTKSFRSLECDGDAFPIANCLWLNADGSEDDGAKIMRFVCYRYPEQQKHFILNVIVCVCHYTFWQMVEIVGCTRTTTQLNSISRTRFYVARQRTWPWLQSCLKQLLRPVSENDVETRW